MGLCPGQMLWKKTMLEAKGNLWEFIDGIPAITTNGYIKKNGQAVLGRGCAKEAAERFSGLSEILGFNLIQYANHVFYLHQFGDKGIITFPVKDAWSEKAKIELIERSAEELIEMTIPHFEIKEKIYLPRPGCGNGGLKWEDVKPEIEKILTDQVVVISKED